MGTITGSTKAGIALVPATFSLEHYEHMLECGAFDGEFQKRVELLWGEILEKHTGVPAKFSLDHYEYMIAVGAFDPPFNIPVELIDGVIVMMSPIGPSHSNEIDVLAKWSFQEIEKRPIRVRIQNPLRLPCGNSEPEPDICWVREGDYSQQHPTSSDILLLIEVAGSSLLMDRGPKLAAYAQAGVADYWIVNLIDEQIEVYREPSDTEYKTTSAHRGHEAVSPLVLPDAELFPSNLFRS